MRRGVQKGPKHGPPPVHKDGVYEVVVEGLGHSGQGVGRVEGFSLFIEGAIPGDVVRAQMTEVKQSYGRARIQELLRPSPDRVEPVCPHYALCGGCQLQHMSYDAQLRWKKKQVEDALRRIGHLRDVRVHPTLGMSNPYYYRNKAQYPVGTQDGTVIMGFYQRGTHRIVDLSGCPIESRPNSRVLTAARQVTNDLRLPVYDESSGTGFLRHVLVRSSRSTGEVMVVVITNGRYSPGLEEFAPRLAERSPEIVCVAQNINEERTNVILGRETRILWGKSGIMDRIGELRFFISPRSFFQVNPEQTEVLYKKALAFADIEGGEMVFDLYCGIGTISLFFAKAARLVVGIDDVPEAIADAWKNAKLNHTDNVEFIAGKVERELPALKEKGIRPQIMVLDPPRAGCSPVVLETIIAQAPRKIVYVSCNPSTLARDLAQLVKHNGYDIVEVQPVDMFPQTSHIEAVAKLRLRSGQ